MHMESYKKIAEGRCNCFLVFLQTFFFIKQVWEKKMWWVRSSFHRCWVPRYLHYHSFFNWFVWNWFSVYVQMFCKLWVNFTYIAYLHYLATTCIHLNPPFSTKTKKYFLSWWGFTYSVFNYRQSRESKISVITFSKHSLKNCQ